MGAFPLHKDLGGGWHQVDSGYYTEGHTSVYVVADGGRAAVLDTANSAATPRIVEALGLAGVDPAAVDHVLVSHIHLDHSGGAGTLLDELPNAACWIHPRSERHLADPAQLIAGARTVYGDRYDGLYGTVKPVPADRIRTVDEGGELAVGGRKLEVIATPGHTFDSVCAIDRQADCLFAGDAFGVTLPPEFGAGGAMRVPAAPTQFAPREWKETLRRIAGAGVSRVMLAHFGPVEGDLGAKAGEMCGEIDAFIGFAREAKASDDPAALIEDRIRQRWLGALGEGAADLPGNMLDNDVNLVKLGLSLWTAERLDSYDG